MQNGYHKVGIYDPYLFELGGGERYIGIWAETLQHNYYVEIISHDSTRLDELENRFRLDLGDVGKRELPPKVPRREKSKSRGWLRRFIGDRAHDKSKMLFSADYDLFINLSNGIPNYSLAENSILLLQMPYCEIDAEKHDDRKRWKERLRQELLGAPLTIEEVLKLRSYKKKIANSDFTRRWISKLWNVDSEVVYTGLDTSIFTPAKKENIILSVGRFQPDMFCKNQHILVETFKRMCAEGLTNWELHLAGGVSEKREEKEYFLQIADAAKGYPIELHPNTGFEKLQQLYGKSRIFWHATGLTEDEEKTPWRMEHFGLTTVEAMCAGCVPVVISKGGQPEIVTHEVDGLLWNTIDKLKSHTWKLIRTSEIENDLRLQAIDRSRDYEKSIFQRNIKAVVGTVQHCYEEAFV